MDVSPTRRRRRNKIHLHYVFMKYDPEYERLRSNEKTKYELDVYLSKKHDKLLSNNLHPGTYNKTISLVIVDGFAIEITDAQANVLRSAKEVRVVVKNPEL